MHLTAKKQKKLQQAKLANNVNREGGEDVKRLCGRTAAVRYMFRLGVVSMDMVRPPVKVEPMPTKMLTNNAEKVISIASEELPHARMHTKISNTKH